MNSHNIVTCRCSFVLYPHGLYQVVDFHLDNMKRAKTSDALSSDDAKLEALDAEIKDTLKRAVKAGDGTILATSPPYTKFLNSGVDFAIVSPGTPSDDIWVQEFLKHEIPCVSADYLVEYVCKTGFSLEGHVLFDTNAWAEKSLANLMIKSEEIVVESQSDEEDDVRENDATCYVCGLSDRGELMLICGNESGSSGCGSVP